MRQITSLKALHTAAQCSTARISSCTYVIVQDGTSSIKFCIVMEEMVNHLHSFSHCYSEMFPVPFSCHQHFCKSIPVSDTSEVVVQFGHRLFLIRRHSHNIYSLINLTVWQKLYVLQSLLNTPGTRLFRGCPACRIDLTLCTFRPHQGYGASESFILRSLLNCPASL